MQLILTTPFWLLSVVAVLIMCDYLVLSGYDILALRYLKKKLSFPLILEASSVGFAFGNTIGHSYLSGGALRYLFYTKNGISRMKIMLLIAFETVMFCLGMMVTYIVAIGLLPLVKIDVNHMHLGIFYVSGMLVLLAFSFYLLCVFKFHKKLRLCHTELKTPTPSNVLAQIIVSCCDNLFLNLVFFVLLRYHFDIDFITSFVVCVLSMTIGMCMQSPGGLGIFEGLVLLLLPHTTMESGSILAGLISFRVLYFFIPFLIACLYLLGRWCWLKTKSPL